MIDDMAAAAFFVRSGGALVVAARRVGGVVVDRRGPCGLRQGPCHVRGPADGPCGAGELFFQKFIDTATHCSLSTSVWIADTHVSRQTDRQYYCSAVLIL